MLNYFVKRIFEKRVYTRSFSGGLGLGFEILGSF